MADFVKVEEEEKKPKKKKSILSFRNIVLFAIAFFLLSSLLSGLSYSITPKIAVVPIKGVILTEAGTTLTGDSSISSREIANILDSIRADPSIKAVILDIDSPGGSPVASEEISMAINEIKDTVPVYALINDVGASGAFWVSVSANKTYASSMSILGSIGVTSATLGFEEFIKEYNVTYRRQTAGEFKDMGSPFREPTVEEEVMLQGILDEIHGAFISHVAKERGMTYEEVEKYATGEVFLGTKAKNVGFIDEIGYYPDVLDEVMNTTNSYDALIIEYGPEPTLAEILGVKSLFNFGSRSQVLLI